MSYSLRSAQMTPRRRKLHSASQKQMARVQEGRVLKATLETVDERGYASLSVAQIGEGRGGGRLGSGAVWGVADGAG